VPLKWFGVMTLGYEIHGGTYCTQGDEWNQSCGAAVNRTNGATFLYFWETSVEGFKPLHSRLLFLLHVQYGARLCKLYVTEEGPLSAVGLLCADTTVSWEKVLIP
jgi:hypothetical protein